VAKGSRTLALSVSARFDRRGLRFARTGCRRILRDDALCAEQPVFGVESRLRSSGACLPSHLWSADAYDQLLEQLRAAAVSREADPADDRQFARGQTTAA